VSSPDLIRPDKNAIIYDGPKFFVYREQLAAGDTRARHSHSQRVEIRLSNGPMLHQWVWEGDQVKEIDPSRVNWREPMIHEVRNVGDAPLDNFILEFLPEK
jgi:quercetin dioxygenase-like cupin family protein